VARGIGSAAKLRHFFQLDRYQQEIFGHLKDAIAVIGKHNHLVAGLLVELAPPTFQLIGSPRASACSHSHR
jgi:hypothetical protein